MYVQTGKGLRLANVTFDDSPNVDHFARLNCQTADKKKKRCESSSPSKLVSSPVKDGFEEVLISPAFCSDTTCHVFIWFSVTMTAKTIWTAAVPSGGFARRGHRARRSRAAASSWSLRSANGSTRSSTRSLPAPWRPTMTSDSR